MSSLLQEAGILSQRNDQGQFNPYAPPTAGVNLGIRSSDDPYGGGGLMAGRGARLGARILDGLIASPFWGVLAVMRGSGSNALGVFLFCGLGLLALLCYQWYLTATTGQTIGKRMLGIRVVKMDGSPVDFVSGVILREWVNLAINFVPFVGGCVSLIGYCLIFGEEQRCLHDRIANTKVVLAGSWNAQG